MRRGYVRRFERSGGLFCAAARFTKCYGSCRVVRFRFCCAMRRSALREILRLVPRRATPTSAMRCVAALRSDTPLPALSSAPSCLEPCHAFPPAPSAGARLSFTARLSSRWASTMPSASNPAVPSTAAPSRSRPAAPPCRAFPRRISPFLRSNRSISSLFAGNLEKSSF